MSEPQPSQQLALEALRNGVAHISRTMAELNEVAAKTKLLSFNAAIIAAQAGEHGRSFAVVAEQMKALNQRTHASTLQLQQTLAHMLLAQRALHNSLAPSSDDSVPPTL